MKKITKVALISIALTATAPSIAFAAHTETMIAAAIGGAAGALIGSNIGHADRDRYYDDYQVRHVYIAREQPVERVYYVRPDYRQPYYYEPAPRYYQRHHHHGRFRDDDDDD